MSQVKGVKGIIKVAGSATETGRYGEVTFSFPYLPLSMSYLNHQGRVIDRGGNSGI
jgi:hypothetical protein